MKIDELNAYVVEFDLDIIGITETWLNEGISNSEIAIENFSIYRKDRSEVKGGRAGEVIVYMVLEAKYGVGLMIGLMIGSSG